ncbi:MAG: outer membrane beta-barrel protein [Hyphomonadaceae bacterium]
MKRSFIAAAVVFSVAPQLAAAQDADRGRNESVTKRQRPEYDALGVRLGAFEVKPEVKFGVETNDNIFPQNIVSQDDVIYSIAPTIAATSDWSRHMLRARVSSDSNFHQDFDGEDRTNVNVDGEFRLDVGSAGSLSVGGFYTDGSEPRTSPDSPATALSPIDFTISDYYASAMYTFNRVRASARLERAVYDYSDVGAVGGGILDEDYRDHDETTSTLRMEYAVNPGVALVAYGSYLRSEYDLNPPAVAVDRDSDGYRVMVGANADLTNLLRGELTVGYMSQEWDTAGVSVDGLAVEAEAEYFITRITTISAFAHRRVEETGVFPAAGKSVTAGGLRVDHELLRNVLLTAGADYAKEEYEGADREDKNWNADIGATYLMNRHASWDARYYYTDWKSEGVNRGFDYDVNRFMISLTLKI